VTIDDRPEQERDEVFDELRETIEERRRAKAAKRWSGCLSLPRTSEFA
jgi:hypothetical protein